MPSLNLGIIGKRFGKLVVLDNRINDNGINKWECQCDCGNRTFVYTGKLNNGHTTSCGCNQSTLQGLSNHRLYKTWWSMKERCYRKNCTSYKNYGAKGVFICDEWQDFKSFYDWAIHNGYDDSLTIERKDSNGPYSPQNCEWITLSENVARANANKPKRKSAFLYYGISPQGKEYIFANANEFAKEHQLNANSLRRVARGERSHYKEWKFGFTDTPNHE